MFARCRAVTFLIGFGAAGWVQAQAPLPDVAGMPEDILPGLGPILKTAMERSPDSVRRSIDVMMADGTRIIGESVRRPSVGASARFLVNQESTRGGNGIASNNSGLFYDLSMNQPLYAWGALKATAERDRIGLQIAEKNYAEGYRSLALVLRGKYLELIAKKGLIRATRAQLTLDRAALDREEAKLKAGTISPGALGGSRVTVEQRQLDLDRAVVDFDTTRRSLMRMAGLAELNEESIPDALPRPAAVGEAGTAMLQAFLRGGVNETFQVQALALGVQQSERGIVIASKRLYPRFSLFAGYNVRSETQADATRINQVAVESRYYGIRTDWAIFDGFATKGEKIRALAAKRSYERLLKSHVDESLDAARHQWTQVGFAARALDLRERAFTGAQNALKQLEEDRAAGRVTDVDIETGRQAVLGAESAILPVRADYLMQWSHFVSLVGADPAMKNLPVRYAR